MRNWPIARKLAAVLAVPLVVMTALAAFQSAASFGRASAADRTRQFARFEASVDVLVADLEEELVATTTVTGERYQNGMPQFAEAVRHTNAGRATVTAAAARLPLGDHDRLRAAVDTALAKLREIDAERDRVNKQQLGRGAGPEVYGPVIGALLDVASTSVGVGSSNLEVIRDELAAASISQAKQAATLERGSVALIVFLGQRTPAAVSAVREAAGAKTAWLTQFRDAATPAQQAAYQRLVGAFLPPIDSLRERVLAQAQAGHTVDLPPQDYWGPSAKEDAGFRTLEQQMTSDLEAAAGRVAHNARQSAWLLTALVLAGVGLSAASGAMVALSMVRQVGTARRAVLDAAQKRLPQVMARLGRGEPVDDTTAAVPAQVVTRDEIGQLAAAANTLFATAVASGRDALASRAVGAQVVGIGRRIRGMVDRNLRLLDSLERGEVDHERLERLFALDSLAAQQRRYVEGLFVLAGEPPDQSVRPPADLLEVARGAASEVGDYKRVEIVLAGADTLRVKGMAVADVTHLMAELIANATAFSPPETPVKVRTEPAYRGCALVVEDRGPGLRPEAMRDLNERLVNPPDFDPTTAGEQLGLAVVARLAKRHEISVRLRESAYRGVDAIVLLPNEIFESTPGAPTGPIEPVEEAPPPRRVPRRQGLPHVALGSQPAEASAPSGRRLAMAPAGRHRSGTVDPLPRRTRGQHLAPQLTGERRNRPPAATSPGADPTAVGKSVGEFHDSWDAGVRAARRTAGLEGEHT